MKTKYLISALALAPILLAACAGEPTPNTTTPAAQLTAQAEKDKHVCYKEPVTGSLVQKQVVCSTDTDGSRNDLADQMHSYTSSFTAPQGH